MSRDVLRDACLEDRVLEEDEETPALLGTDAAQLDSTIAGIPAYEQDASRDRYTPHWR